MNPQEMSSKSGDKSAAALSLATMISEQLLKMQNPLSPTEGGSEMPENQVTESPIEGEGSAQESPETTETAPGQEEIVEEPQDTMNQDYEAKMVEMTDKIGELEMDIELMKKAIIGDKNV